MPSASTTSGATRRAAVGSRSVRAVHVGQHRRRPRGIALSLDALDANLASMYDWLEPRDGAVVCSWLPLSHDMGLIGLALYAICSVNPPWSVPTDLVLMTPESFLADPSSWMRACTDYRATSTTSPPFALRLAARALRGRSGAFDLSSLRSFVVGSEPVPAETLREFEEVARRTSACPRMRCVPVTAWPRRRWPSRSIRRPAWSSVRVDSEALAEREWQRGRRGRHRTRVVRSSGARKRRCASPAADALGELEIRGPSLLSHYVPDEAARSDGGRLVPHGRPGASPQRGGVHRRAHRRRAHRGRPQPRRPGAGRRRRHPGRVPAGERRLLPRWRGTLRGRGRTQRRRSGRRGPAAGCAGDPGLR